jgi:hypothetical protein
LRSGCDGQQQAAKEQRQLSQIHPSRIMSFLNCENTFPNAYAPFSEFAACATDHFQE